MGSSNQGLNVHTAYTWISTVYCWCRKLLMYIVGLGRVELPTSRLSGPLVRKGCVASHGEFSPVETSRHFRRERERGQKPPPARTQGVHAKEDGYEFGGHLGPRSLTNLFRRFRSPEKALKSDRAPRNTSENFSSVSLPRDPFKYQGRDLTDEQFRVALELDARRHMDLLVYAGRPS
jgi:hypothetical protein